jgi:hypothetical protein
MTDVPEDAPKQINLTRENYESICVDPDDGSLVLELTDETAEWLHSEGFRSTEGSDHE